jgi:hypothetical protein
MGLSPMGVQRLPSFPTGNGSVIAASYTDRLGANHRDPIALVQGRLGLAWLNHLVPQIFVVNGLKPISHGGILVPQFQSNALTTADRLA